MFAKQKPGEFRYYVVEDEWGNFWCGKGGWEEKLNHAVLYTRPQNAQKSADTFKSRHPRVRRVVIVFDDYGIGGDGTEFTYEYNVEIAEDGEDAGQ